MDRGIETFIQAGKQSLRRSHGAVVALTLRGRLFVLPCQVVSCPMLLALVDEEPAGRAPGPPPVDEEIERELMGREEVAPVALEIPTPGEPCSDERRHHGHTHIVLSVVQRLRQSSRESKRTLITITSPTRHTRHQVRRVLPED